MLVVVARRHASHVRLAVSARSVDNAIKTLSGASETGHITCPSFIRTTCVMNCGGARPTNPA
eukprot:3327870-Alexandrium_andersonii.AAC.1